MLAALVAVALQVPGDIGGQTLRSGADILVVRHVSGVDRLYAVDAISGLARPLRSPLAEATGSGGYTNNRSPAWSRDGTFVAFEDRNYDLFVMGSNGTHKRRLTEAANGGLAGTWSWSPRGHALAFSMNRPRVGVDDLFLWRGAGSPTLILADAHHPVWRADGRILFERDYGKLFAITPHGKELKLIDDDVSGVFLSPDRRRLVLQSLSPLAEHVDLETAWGRGRRRILNGDIEVYAWAPDGSRIAYSRSYPAGTINLVNVDTGRQTRVATQSGWDVDDIEWSPGGDMLAYQTSQPTRNNKAVTRVIATSLVGPSRVLFRETDDDPDEGLQLAQWELAQRLSFWER